MVRLPSNHPYELFDIEEVHHAEWVLEMVEKGEFTFNDEKYKAKFIEAQKKIIKEKSEKAGLIKKP
ncbi:hypothetical protein BC352_19510 [Vibrio cholerae]|nr:hypothetical protein [Vibrio cholerae]RGP95118.1 hypothetical protein BC352_19510 [Vibrio cholerae]